MNPGIRVALKEALNLTFAGSERKLGSSTRFGGASEFRRPLTFAPELRHSEDVGCAACGGVRRRAEAYPLDVERQDEPLADGRAEDLVGLGEGLALSPHVLDVEHVVQVAVFVGDEVEHHVTFVFVRVDVVEGHESVGVVTRGHGLPGLSVEDVDQSLWRKQEVRRPLFLFRL